MRDYGKVSPAFWIGATGKSLRGDMEAQIVALYLMTSPHATMTGVYHCPILYIAHETGIPIEGASKALARLIEGGFCEYDEASELVFVIRMAAFQVGESLNAKDKRQVGIQRDYEKMPESRIKQRFFEIYGAAFQLAENKPLASPLQAPSKPRAGTRAGTRAETELLPPPAGDGGKGSRLASDWVLPDAWADEAQRIVAESGKSLDVKREAAKFRDFWVAKSGKDAVKRDWLATWRNWIRNAADRAPSSKSGAVPTAALPDFDPLASALHFGEAA